MLSALCRQPYAENAPLELAGFKQVDICSVMCVPFYNQYETFGCILFINRADGTFFTQEDTDVCEIIAMITVTAIDDNHPDLGVSAPKPVLIHLRNIQRKFKNGDYLEFTGD